MHTLDRLSLLTGALLLTGVPAFAAPADLFQPETVLELKLNAPLAQMFKAAKAAKSKDSFKAYPGTIEYSQNGAWRPLKAQFRVRGNTSVADCSFLKLEVELDKTAPYEASPFKGHRKFKIGTHCADSKLYPDYTETGRLKSDAATHAEAFTYRLAARIGVDAPRARYAKIAYQDPAKTTVLERKAFLLESHGDVAERLNLKKLESDERDAVDVDLEAFDRVHLANVHYFEMLVGNADYGIPLLNRQGSLVRRAGSTGTGYFWNVKIMQGTDAAQSRVIPYDFDLTLPVRAAIMEFDPEARARFDRFVRLPTDHARQSWLDQQALKSLFTPEQRNPIRERLKAKKKEILAYLASSPLTANAKLEYTKQLEGFYAALSVADQNVSILETSSWYNDATANRDDAQCWIKTGAPIGLPVREIPGVPHKFGLKQVEMIDPFNTMVEVGSFQPCANPGWIPVETPIGRL